METDGKKYMVIISDEATQILVSHSRFLTRVSEKAALNFNAEFSEKAKSLEEFPERNPWLSDPFIPDGKYRKLLMSKRYMLIYQVKSDVVYVYNLVKVVMLCLGNVLCSKNLNYGNCPVRFRETR